MLMNEKNESRFESIFDNVNEGILIARFDGPIVLVNPKISDMFQYAEQELKGNTVEMLIPERFRGGHVERRHKKK